MTRTIITIALFFSLLPGIFAKDITLCRFDKTPVIDGDFSDECWRNCDWQNGFTSIETGEREKEKTRFKIMADKKGIYFAIQY